MNDNQNLLLAGVFQMLAALIPLFKRAGRPDVADDVAAILGRSGANYREVIAVADARMASETD